MSTATTSTASVARTRLALASLVGMAMLWGSTFFCTKALAGRIPVPDLLALRFLIMTTVTGALYWRHWRMSAETLRRGVAVGVVYGVAQLVQTIGLQYTDASVSGFVTGLYVVFTPFMAAWLLRERIPGSTWLAVVLATLGLAMLTVDPSHGLRIGLGEWLTLVGAVLYAVQIIGVDRWVTVENAPSLTLVEMATVTVVTGLFALPDGITRPSSSTDWWVMLYLALVAGAIPIFLQVWAQTIIESTTAAVLMAGEPVWAAVFAVLLGGENLTWQIVFGGGAMFGAMMLVTMAPRLRRR